MLTSLALVFLVGLALAALCQKLKLPRIIGMLATGILLGPCVLNVLDGSILSISADLRKLALVIILLKAGLSLDLGDLKKVGRPAILMSCLPATCEIIGYVLLAPCFLGITHAEAAVMGAVLAAVSPAVVVPRMVQLMESGRGTDKSIPQMILAGASCDDIFVIVLFTTFLHTAQGGSANAADFLSIPASIVLGVALGALVGWLLSRFFETAYARSHCIRNSMKVIIVLGVSLLLVAAEGWLEGIVPVSGLLAVVSMACLLKMKCTPFVAKRLSEKFGKTVAVRYFFKQSFQAEECVFGVRPTFIHPVIFHQRVYQSEHIIGRMQDIVQITDPATTIAFRRQLFRTASDSCQRSTQVMGH